MEARTATFNALYVAYAADVYGFALHLCDDRDEAEDITSEAFVRVWTSNTPIRTETVKGYLLTIARNVFLHERRRGARKVALSGSESDATLPADVRVEQRDQLAAVQAQLATLKEIDRSALWMHATQDMTYDEIATVLGISLASVKIKIYRARLTLAHIRQDQRI